MFAKVLPLIVNALADGKLTVQEVVEIILALISYKS